MGWRRLIKWSISLVVLAVITAGVSVLLSPRTLSVSAVERVSKPVFPFEVVWENEEEVGFREAMIVVSPEYYSGPNVRHVLLWYSQVHHDKKSVHIKLFTNRDRAVFANFTLPMNSLRPLVHLYPWDADYFRSGRYPGKVEEVYGYRPIRWFPFWREEVILRDDFGPPHPKVRGHPDATGIGNPAT